MAKIKPRVKVPKKADKGDVVTIKSLISHRMHSGLAKDKKGNIIPQNIIKRFDCTFDGAKVFGCDIEAAVSANPYFQFTAKVEKSGEFHFTWLEDNGNVYEAKKKIMVS